MELPFPVSVVERPRQILFGIKVRTSMARASEDCPRLWSEAFGPRMHEVAGVSMDKYTGDSYGISIMSEADVASGAFDYWAAMLPGTGVSMPQGMDEVVIPGGWYAFCEIPSLEKLGEAYSYLYGPWIAARSEYVLSMGDPCFELYGPDFIKSGKLGVFVPVKKK